jgi:hypothetical protein
LRVRCNHLYTAAVSASRTASSLSALSKHYASNAASGCREYPSRWLRYWDHSQRCSVLLRDCKGIERAWPGLYFLIASGRIDVDKVANHRVGSAQTDLPCVQIGSDRGQYVPRIPACRQSCAIVPLSKMNSPLRFSVFGIGSEPMWSNSTMPAEAAPVAMSNVKNATPMKRDRRISDLVAML